MLSFCFILSSCGFFGSQGIDENSPEDEITVSCAVRYTNEIDRDTEHKISIPKIFPASKKAKEFNQKLMSKHSSAIELLNKGTQENKVYNISYIFEEYDGIFGILIKDFTYVMNSGGNCKLYGYYFDTKKDRELDFFQYLEALGVDYSELVSEVNSDIDKYYPDDGYIMSEKYVDYDIKAAIFSKNKAHIVLPSYGFGQMEAVYDKCFVGKGDPKYDIATILENYYYNEIQDLNFVFYGRIIDLDNDNFPELVVNFFDGLTCSLHVYKIGNGIEQAEDIMTVHTGSMVWGEYNLCMTSFGTVELKLYEGYRDEPWGDYTAMLYVTYIWDGIEWQETQRGGADSMESFEELYGFDYSLYRLPTPNDIDDYDIRSAWERQKEVRGITNE